MLYSLWQVNKSMAHRLRGEFTNKLKQQAIFELLGPTFVGVYFPHHEVRGGIHRQFEAADHL
jgi:hypothetical protein